MINANFIWVKPVHCLVAQAERAQHSFSDVTARGGDQGLAVWERRPSAVLRAVIFKDKDVKVVNDKETHSGSVRPGDCALTATSRDIAGKSGCVSGF